MAKCYSVSPVRLPGRKTFTANFRGANGQRLCRSLGTVDEDYAQLLCAGLVRLHKSEIRNIGEVPSDVPLDAIRLYFGEAEFSDPSALQMDGAAVDQNLAAAHFEVKKFPKPLRAQVLPILLDRHRLQRENEGLRLEASAWKRNAEAETEKRELLERSVLGRAEQASRNMPAFDAALKLFEAHIKATTTAANAQKHTSCAEDFISGLPSTLKTLAEVQADHVCAFLDQKTAAGNQDHALGRRREWRIRISRILNWGAKRWGFNSPMVNVPGVPRHTVLRERGDFVWHQLGEVETVIKGLPDDYWRGLVATLAYGGLQLAELVWLRVSDVEISPDGKRGQVWVTTVEDPDDPRVRHMLKTSHRRRHVDLHPRLLLPRLKKMIKEKLTGDTFFFAMPKDMRRREREGDDNGSERWQPGVLSTVLRGHPGGKKRLPLPGKLPKGMNAKSLRRTFGSLLLRSGKTTAEVAAAMGNTEDVVRQHYARILGGEVDVDF